MRIVVEIDLSTFTSLDSLVGAPLYRALNTVTGDIGRQSGTSIANHLRNGGYRTTCTSYGHPITVRLASDSDTVGAQDLPIKITFE